MTASGPGAGRSRLPLANPSGRTDLVGVDAQFGDQLLAPVAQDVVALVDGMQRPCGEQPVA